MRRKGNKFNPFNLLVGGWNYNSKEYKNTYSLNSVMIGLGSENMLNFNIVEGFDLAPKFNWRHFIDTGRFLYGSAAARYGFSNTHYEGIGRLYYWQQDRAFRNRTWIYGGEAGQYVFQFDPDNPVLPWFNTYSALFFRENDLKLYERKEASAFLRRNYGTGLNWFVKTSYQQRNPLQNTTTYTFINGDKNSYDNNNVVHLVDEATAWQKNDAALVYATLSYKPGYTYTQFPDYKVANGKRLAKAHPQL